MLALKIIDVKSFMNQLLLGEIFDHLQVAEVSITTFNTFSIDGKLKKEFFDSDEQQQLSQTEQLYSYWKELKPFCFSIIKGKRTPLNFKIIFQLTGRSVQNILVKNSSKLAPETIRGLFLNLQYKNNELLCTTGISLNTFLMDKAPEQLWDAAVLSFFQHHHILFEKL